ncbi:Site-specific DNA recombinase [Palleronia marisminoris]|uniref:DNA-invertase hin n=1 Tax=Palleronia marisminoris TaxID=315423 RepID=A0A1Y5SA28_9RHOB|nr:recombinase family protein [Palleronia marisminoris]SFG69493.1 Site-specific DNA recombinase [Palleronia marisminoris]SLN35657.1 DNA-invertase hin [Palleronia marisminoris]
MAHIGYARVSSRTQDLTIQTTALTGAGCEKIFAEKISGTRTDGRKELSRMLDYVREGDVLVCTKLDRLARSLPDLLKITETLEQKGVQLRCLDQAIDTTTPEGRMTYQILGAVAEFETSIRKARQREGIDAALAKGDDSPFKGRPPSIKPEEVAAAVEKHGNKAAAARALGISRDSVYRILREAQTTP